MVADPGYGTLNSYTSGHPNRILIGPGAEIIQVGGSVSDRDIQAILPSSYP